MNITAAERKSFKLRLDDSVSVINLVVETPDGDEIIIAYFAEGGVLITLVNEEWELDRLSGSGLQFGRDGTLMVA